MTGFYRKQKYDFFPYQPPPSCKYYINQTIFPIRKPSVRTDARPPEQTRRNEARHEGLTKCCVRS